MKVWFGAWHFWGVSCSFSVLFFTIYCTFIKSSIYLAYFANPGLFLLHWVLNITKKWPPPEMSCYQIIIIIIIIIFFFSTIWHNWALTAKATISFKAADEVAPRKRLTSLLKLALDLMASIWARREFHNWAVHGRNDLAWLTRFDLGTSTARSWDLIDRGNLGSWLLICFHSA